MLGGLQPVKQTPPITTLLCHLQNPVSSSTHIVKYLIMLNPKPKQLRRQLCNKYAVEFCMYTACWYKRVM
jgi:hypothetical protein